MLLIFLFATNLHISAADFKRPGCCSWIAAEKPPQSSQEVFHLFLAAEKIDSLEEDLTTSTTFLRLTLRLVLRRLERASVEVDLLLHSRVGGSTPVLWSSKPKSRVLQRSNTSHYLWQWDLLLPLWPLVFEVADASEIKRDKITKVSWEDNKGAPTTANAPFA